MAEQQRYMLVVNAGNIAKDLAWVTEQAQRFPSVTVTDISETLGLLALQGPVAQEILQPLTEVDLASIGYYHFAVGPVSDINCIVSRTGYTGEDGFELYCPDGSAADLWNAVLAAGKIHGLLPAGLGARDTLRLEAGYCLYGHELDEQTNPLEARLGWTIKLNKGEFIGREALQRVKEQKPARLLMGVVMVERGVARSGYTVYAGDEQIGQLTSGAPGPTVGKNIGMAYIAAPRAVAGTPVQVEIRGRKVAAELVSLPFYKRK
jgi:aminomethyltransferase